MNTVSINNNEKKEHKYEVSEDTLDYLDTQVDEFNETDNLGKKITIHRKLKTITKSLIDEIDSMVAIIDDIDQSQINSYFYEPQEDNNDINDDIIKLEDMLETMEEEESIQLKISHYKRITEIVKRCKTKCNDDKMNVLNIN